MENIQRENDWIRRFIVQNATQETKGRKDTVTQTWTTEQQDDMSSWNSREKSKKNSETMTENFPELLEDANPLIK
jgi:hypothetical protein